MWKAYPALEQAVRGEDTPAFLNPNFLSLLMYEKLIITGVPGTGKTEVAKKLGDYFKTRIIHINDYVKEHDLILKKERDGTLVVDVPALRKKLNVEQGIIEGHLACEMKLRNSFVIVLRCDPKVLKERLKKRKYKPKKIKENIESEILDYCTIKSNENFRSVYEVETTNRTVEESVDLIKKIIYGESKGDEVDFSNYL